METTAARACPMTFSFAPGDDQQQLAQTTVTPSQPHAPRQCPVPAPGRIAHAPGVSPCRGRPRAGTHPRNIPSQRDVRAASPRRHQHSRSCLPIGAGHPHPSLPIPLCTCPIWLLSPSDTDIVSITAGPGASETFRTQAQQCYWCHLLLLRYKAICGENCMCVWHSPRRRLPLVVCLAPRLDKQVHEQFCSHLPRGWYQQESQYAVKILFRLY